MHVSAVKWSALVAHNEAQGSILDLIIFAISQAYIRDINVKCETMRYVQCTVYGDVTSTFPKQIWTLRRNLLPSHSTQCHISEYWPPTDLSHKKFYWHTNMENSQLTLCTTQATTSRRKLSTARYSTCITASPDLPLHVPLRNWLHDITADFNTAAKCNRFRSLAPQCASTCGRSRQSADGLPHEVHAGCYLTDSPLHRQN